MSAIDAGVGIVLLWLAWQGFSRGLVGSLVWLLLIAVTPVLAGRVAPMLTGVLGTLSPDLPIFLRQPAAVIASLILTGIVLGLASGVLTGLVGRLLKPLPLAQLTNQAAGVLLATGAGVLGLGISTLLLSGFLSADQREQLDATIWGGAVAPHLAPLSPYVRALLPIPSLATPCDLPPELIGAALTRASPASTSSAAQALLSALPAQATVSAGVPGSNIEAARPFFEAVAGGGTTQSLPPEATLAAAGMLKTMLGCPGADRPDAAILPAGSAAAARFFLEAAMSGQGR